MALIAIWGGRNSVWPDDIGDNSELATDVTVDSISNPLYWRMRRMAWNKSHVSDERLKVIAEVLRGEEFITELFFCLGFAQKQGYKWLARYRAGGPPARADMSRRPHANPRATPTDISDQILAFASGTSTNSAFDVYFGTLHLGTIDGDKASSLQDPRA